MTSIDYDVSGRAATDPGLRAFLLQVFGKVAGGLFLSAAIAFAVATVAPLREALFVMQGGAPAGYTLLGWVILLAPLVLLLAASLLVREPSAGVAGLIYWSTAALVGASLSVLVLVYAGATLISTFLITAAAFGALALWGYTTHRNLSGFGNFLVVALVGLILVMLVNIFLRNAALGFVIDAVGVLVFAGLIAADTQRLKRIYYELPNPEALGAASSFGALSLYLNFINLFQFLLSLFGGQRR